MSDKEILIQSINKYAQDLAEKLFNLNSIAVKSVITYVLQNMEDKYAIYLDLFADKEGNINMSLLGNAFKEELKNRKGFIVSIFGKSIKFTEKDVDDLMTIYSKFKQNA